MKLSNWLVPSFWIILFITEITSMCLGRSCPWILALIPAAFMIFNTCEDAIIDDLLDRFEEGENDEIE